MAGGGERRICDRWNTSFVNCYLLPYCKNLRHTFQWYLNVSDYQSSCFRRRGSLFLLLACWRTVLVVEAGGGIAIGKTSNNNNEEDLEQGQKTTCPFGLNIIRIIPRSRFKIDVADSFLS